MANSAKRRGQKIRRGRKPAAVEDGVTASIVLVNVEDAPQYYANHVEVTNTIHEFEMLFARFPAKISPDQMQEIRDTGKVEVEPLVRIVIPPSLMPDLIKVFEAQQEKYQSAVKAAADRKDSGSEQ